MRKKTSILEKNTKITTGLSMKEIIILISLLALGACSKGNSLSDQEKVKFNLFSSSSDPCMVPGKCSNPQIVPPLAAMKILERGAYKSTPQLGLKTSRNVVTTRSTTEEVNGDYQEINCAISYDIARTVVDLTASALYVKEEKSNFKYQPNSRACRKLGEMKEFDSLLIAIEERKDLSPSNELPLTEEQLRKLKMESLTVDSRPFLRISGIVDSTMDSQDIDGNPIQIPVETSVLLMLDLTQSYFSAEFFNHTITKIPGMLPSETINDTLTLNGMVDVSDFQIEDYINSIVDRRDEAN